jgi:hypothetical protein
METYTSSVYMPEMKGRSLEELEEMWQAKVPPRKFGSWKSSNPASIGHLITETEAHPERAKELDLEMEEAAKEESKNAQVEHHEV